MICCLVLFWLFVFYSENIFLQLTTFVQHQLYTISVRPAPHLRHLKPSDFLVEGGHYFAFVTHVALMPPLPHPYSSIPFHLIPYPQIRENFYFDSNGNKKRGISKKKRERECEKRGKSAKKYFFLLYLKDCVSKCLAQLQILWRFFFAVN